MDLLRMALRAVFTFLTLLALLRVSGKRTVKQGSPFDLTVALIVGDLVDDVLLGEVALAQFTVASTTIVAAHVLMDRLRFRAARFRSSGR